MVLHKPNDTSILNIIAQLITTCASNNYIQMIFMRNNDIQNISVVWLV